jgi:membrane protease YdiL (CAAX protease family)
LVSALLEFIVLCVPTVLYLWFRRRSEDHGRSEIGLTRGNCTDYARALGVTVILIGFGLGATRMIPADVLAAAGTTNRITSVVAALAVAVRSAGEEVLFRGFLQGVLTHRLGTVTGIWVQALLFVGMHLPLLAVSPLAWPILPVQLLTGLVLGWLRDRHDSIAPPIAVHVIANVVAGLLV